MTGHSLPHFKSD